MKKSFLALALPFTLFIAACQQIIEIDLPEQTPKLVVNCAFSPDSTWAARVTHSTGIQDPVGPQPVTNALVLIKENGVVIDTLRNDSADSYVSALGSFPLAGHTYVIEASAPGFDPVTGTDYVPVPVQPYDMAWRDSVTTDGFGNYSGEFSFKIDDPTGENYYLLSVFMIDTVFDWNDTFLYVYPVYVQVQDPIFEYDGNAGRILFNDVTFEGTTRVLRVLIWSWDYEAAASGRLFFGLSSASKTFYRYTQTLSSYFEAAYNPFAEPVRVHSNMTPDMGIFAGVSTVFALVP